MAGKRSMAEMDTFDMVTLERLDQLKFASLETRGQISIIPKS